MRRALEYAKMFDRVDHAALPGARADRRRRDERGVRVDAARAWAGCPPRPRTSWSPATSAWPRSPAAGSTSSTSRPARSVELVREGKRRGVRVTAEACPHHFTLTDERLRTFDSNYKMNPPLRTWADVEAVIGGLKDGTIEILATDHAPHAPEKKMRELDQAPFGIVGLETLIPITVHGLIEPGHLTWPEVIRKLTINPAQLLGIPKGTLRPGADADVTIIDPDDPLDDRPDRSSTPRAATPPTAAGRSAAGPTPSSSAARSATPSAGSSRRRSRRRREGSRCVHRSVVSIVAQALCLRGLGTEARRCRIPAATRQTTAAHFAGIEAEAETRFVAGRCDRGGVMVSRQSLEVFGTRRGFADYLENRAQSLGPDAWSCERRSFAILIGRRSRAESSPEIFDRLKAGIVKLSDEGKILLRMGELKQQLEMRLPGESFSPEQLRVSELAGRARHRLESGCTSSSGRATPIGRTQREGTDVFEIKDQCWSDYWQKRSSPVMLVIRTSDGTIRWMEVSEYLRRESQSGKKSRQADRLRRRAVHGFDAAQVPEEAAGDRNVGSAPADHHHRSAGADPTGEHSSCPPQRASTPGRSPGHRELHFKSLEDILADVDRLASSREIRTLGNWSAGQIFEHVAR